MRKLFLLFLAALLVASQASAAGGWTKYTQTWPVESTMVRDIEPFNGTVYISTAAPITNGGQIYSLNAATNRFVKRAHFSAQRVMTLEGLSGKLFVGTGTPHSSENGQTSPAYWGFYDSKWNWTTVLHASTADLIYSQTSDGANKVFAGTFSEDKPGLAKVYQYDISTSTLTEIGGPGKPGWPSHGYAGIYEMKWRANGDVYVTTFDRTPGRGHLLRYRSGVWQNLGGLQNSTIGLALAEYDGSLVVAFSADGVTGNPIQYLDSNDTLQPLGTMPSEWVTDGGSIPNSLDPMDGVLYLGRGGNPNTTGVWSYTDVDGWQQVGGKGQGWWAPLSISSGAEWPYRLKAIAGRLWVAFAGTGRTADLWALEP